MRSCVSLVCESYTMNVCNTDRYPRFHRRLRSYTNMTLAHTGGSQVNRVAP